MAAHTPIRPNNDTQPRLPHLTLLIMTFHPPISPGHLTQPMAIVSIGLFSQAPYSSTQPPLISLVCISFCPTCPRLSVVFFFEPPKLPSCPSWTLPSEGTLPSVASSLGLRSHLSSTSYFSFILPYPVKQRSHLSFHVFELFCLCQQIPYGYCFICKCISDIIMGRSELHIFLFCHLDLDPMP